ncbi:hypothetical protein SAMN06309944_1611 [Micrococcales bacterium KH10]|nr:hypothetical protein SAMN06309944_1611 [Micrococcales bacterium KH10]
MTGELVNLSGTDNKDEDTVDHSSESVVAGRYRLNDRSLALGAVTARHGHDDILDRSVLLVDVTDHVQSLGSDVDVDLVLDAARRAALVSDRRLVKLLDVGRDEEISYIVSEDPAGVPLSEIGLEHWTPRAVRAVLGELAIALEAARSRGVHHQQILADVVQLTPETPRLFGLGFLSVLMTGNTVDGDEACAVDATQLRALGSSLLAGSQRNVDPELAAVLDGDDEKFPTPASIAAALDPWDRDALTAVLTSSGLSGNRESTNQPASIPASDPSLIRTPTHSRFGPKSGPLTPPGTPPPAQPLPGTGTESPVTPRRVSSGVSLGAGAASLLSPVLPPAPETSAAVFAPVGAAAAGSVGVGAAGGVLGSSGSTARGGANAARGSGGSSGRGSKKSGSQFRVSSTLAVLVLVLGLTSLAGFWAFRTIGADLGPTHEVRSLRGQTSASVTEPDASSDDETSQAADYPPPAIASAQQLDPDGDDNEHPEWVDRGFDGDQQTFWATRIYATPNFGGYDRRGIGYAVELEEETLVSTVYLVTESNGGKYELRATTPDKPDGGTLLKSGAFEHDMTIQLDTPTETDSIVLWITELPEIDQGYGLRLAEISLS